MYYSKASVNIGAFADGTAFMNLSEKYQPYGEILTKQFGYHSKGNELLYNGMNGEQIETEIFIGPTYYMRLKHMVKDKINYRSKVLEQHLRDKLSRDVQMMVVCVWERWNVTVLRVTVLHRFCVNQ